MELCMRKKFVHFCISILLLASFCLPYPALAADSSLDASTMRIGLYYGGSALSSANLQNATGYGSGYSFGYCDSAQNFYPLGSTAETKITMVPGTGSTGEINVTVTGTSTVLFTYDQNTYGSGLVVQPTSSDGTEPQTWFKGYKYRGSFRYERLNGASALTVVNLVSLGNYVKGVIPYEMSPDWPVEALKAQAVCARTYALSNLNKHSAYNFDLCATTNCQVYHGVGSSSTAYSANSNTDSAVDGTAGLTVQYGGTYAETYYHSSDGGATESSENVWSNSRPYLVGVADPYEAAVSSLISNYNWTATYTGAELATKLQASGRNCSTIVDVSVTQRTNTGNVYTLTFQDSNGKSWSVSKDSVRTVLGLRSLRYSVSGSGTAAGSVYVNGSATSYNSTSSLYVVGGDGSVSALPGSASVITGSGTETLTMGASAASASSSSASSSGGFTFTGTGWGHNVGMSQWGAYAMAKQGYTYTQIITFYFTGVAIN